MNTIKILAALALTGTALAQGPLTPPLGADPSIGPVNALTPGGLPQATMKTLHQVEPRTAIAGGTGGVVIGQSGAYYLTGNIFVAAGDGISITANHVTLDLNGFSVTSNTGAGIGIAVSGTSHLTIMNGSISGFLAGVAPTNGMQTPRNVRVANLTVSDCANWGVLLEISKNTRVEDCLVDGAVGGIQGTLVSDCSVNAGSISGRIVKDCSVSGATLVGINADVVENCFAQATGTAIQAKCLVNSYGTGGGDSDVISAGVAQNVWAEGGSGSGRGIAAVVVSNSQGSRANDGNGFSNGKGVEAQIVHSTVGSSAYATAVEGHIVSGSRARATNGTGISARIVETSDGWSGTTTGLSGDVVAFSRAKDSVGNGMVGWSVFGSYSANNGGFGINASVVGNSRVNNSGGTGIMTIGDGVVSDSVSISNTGVGAQGGIVQGVWTSGNTGAGIVTNGGVVLASAAESNGGLGVESSVISGVRAASNGLSGLSATGGVIVSSVTSLNNGTGAVGSVFTDSSAIAAANKVAAQATCIQNAYATGNGNLDVLIAGVTQNTWAEGVNGDGDAIQSYIVSNSYGSRSGSFTATPQGISATLALGSYGYSAGGDGINAGIVSSSKGLSVSGRGINSEQIAVSSWGVGQNGGILSKLAAHSHGYGYQKSGIHTDLSHGCTGQSDYAYPYNKPMDHSDPYGIASVVAIGSMGYCFANNFNARGVLGEWHVQGCSNTYSQETLSGRVKYDSH